MSRKCLKSRERATHWRDDKKDTAEEQCGAAPCPLENPTRAWCGQADGPARRTRGRRSPRSFPALGPGSWQNWDDKDLTPRAALPVWTPDLCSLETTCGPQLCFGSRPSKAARPGSGPMAAPGPAARTDDPRLGPTDPRRPRPWKDTPGKPVTFLLKPALRCPPARER